ncbi:carotenoid-cleaving dioxygenase, mitochondrial-like isoform X2 [Brevipalpus obovatus]|uniref:carotenoid-cleaving dioxygenase, mitochondrial-like isoform X2 n=1 Tax=Brevipalpus obovatus TaxID=246614 RepID=UPI003D9EF1C5
MNLTNMGRPLTSLHHHLRCPQSCIITLVRGLTTMEKLSVATTIPHLRSCNEECAEPVEAKVKGTIPKWVKGYLLRNGPGLREIGEDRFQHLFDGMALLHQFEIEDGRIHYRNKFLRSEAYAKNMKANRIVVSDFGTRGCPDPCKNILSRYMSYYSFQSFTDNDAVSIYPIGDQLYASTESTCIRRINPTNLDSLESVDMNKFVAVNTQTAHPHIERDGIVYNLGSNFSGKGSYNLVKIDPHKKADFPNAEILCSLPVRQRYYPSYYHSFCFTENYVIFVEQALVFSIPQILLSHFLGRPFCDSFSWRPEYRNRFNVICKKTGELISDKFISEPFAFFHTINAYEDDGHIVCDICCYRDGTIVNALFAESVIEVQQKAMEGKIHETKYGQSLQSQARRYVIPMHNQSPKSGDNLIGLKNSQAKAYKKGDEVHLDFEPLTPMATNASEMPQINYHGNNGRKYSYFYSLTRRDDYLAQLMKCDVTNRTSKIWSEEHCLPSEPIFVPRPNATSEDDAPST